MTKKTCKRCGYQWLSRVAKPKACPACKRYDWEKDINIKITVAGKEIKGIGSWTLDALTPSPQAICKVIEKNGMIIEFNGIYDPNDPLLTFEIGKTYIVEGIVCQCESKNNDGSYNFKASTQNLDKGVNS